MGGTKRSMFDGLLEFGLNSVLLATDLSAARARGSTHKQAVASVACGSDAKAMVSTGHRDSVIIRYAMWAGTWDAIIEA